MPGFRKLFAAIAAGLLAGCSHAGHVSGVATDFNRAMADTRNSQVLLNIVRAGGREPLQFSSIGEITATVNRSVGLDTVATNLITGGRDAISPTLRLSGSTVPFLRMAPLANKEFVTGLLTPTMPETLTLFLSQGWDSEFVLPLVVQSYRCDGELIENRGEEGSRGEEVRRQLAAAGAGFTLQRKTAPSAAAPPPGQDWVTNPIGLCPPRAGVASEPRSFEIAARGANSLQFRSPEGIIYFLGEALRPCFLRRADVCSVVYDKAGERRYLFRVFAGAGPAGRSAVEATMYGRTYWIPPLDAEDRDRSLKTLEFLIQLIALQTNPVPLPPALVIAPN